MKKNEKGVWGGKLILHVIILGATRKLIKNYNWLWLLLIVTRAFLQTLLGGKKTKKPTNTIELKAGAEILMHTKSHMNIM